MNEFIPSAICTNIVPITYILKYCSAYTKVDSLAPNIVRIGVLNI